MKVDHNLFSVLKNYSELSESILIPQGNKIVSGSEGHTFMSVYETSYNFPHEVGIYELKKFVKLLSLFKEPELEFHENYLIIKSGKTSSQVMYGSRNIIIRRHDFDKVSKFVFEKSEDIEYVVKFILNKDTLISLLSGMNVIGLPQLMISSETGKIVFHGRDEKNRSVGNFVIETDCVVPVKFKAYVQIGQLNCISGDYEVSVGEDVIQFKSTEFPLTYWIAPEEQTILL